MVIRLGDGRGLRLADYMKIVKAAKQHPTAKFPRSFAAWWECDGNNILREYHKMLQDVINRHDPAYGKGRKWKEQYQDGLMRDARRLKEKRQARVRMYSLDTPELRRRFGHLIDDPHEI